MCVSIYIQGGGEWCRLKNIMKKYTVRWDEYIECFTTVEAESEEEAREKFFDDQHGEVTENVESCDELEINEEDEEEIKK
jgi:hypothetical protein